jgi:hypothetical protein
VKEKNNVLMWLLALCILGCQKTPEYVAEEFTCECGNISWLGASYKMLASHQASADSSRLDYRRYHFSGDVRVEGEENTHNLSGWFEVDDIGAGGEFLTDAVNQQFEATLYEYNLNGVADTTRVFVPVSGSLRVNKASGAGASESVTFQMTLNEVLDSTLSTSSVNCSGDFTVTYRPPVQ